MNISNRERISYAAGGFGKNLAYGLVASYTLYYYNSVLGVSASFVGILLMAARIFDAFNDPFMGVVVAKTKSRFGKYKPWIFLGSLTNALILYAMFTVPANLDEGGIKAYISVTYFLCGITYTLGDIPYWSIIPAVTRAGTEREHLTVFARTFSGIGAAAPTVIAMSLVALLGGGTENENLRTGFSALALLIAAVYVGTTLITLINLPKEHTLGDNHSQVTVKELLLSLVTNEHAVWIAVVIVVFNTAISMTLNLAVYLFQYDIGQYDQYTVFMIVSGGVQFAAMVFIYPALRKRWSNRKIFMAGCLAGIAGYLTVTPLIGMKSITLGLLIPSAVGVSLANGLAYVLTTVFVAGAVDYGEKKNGRRDDSVVSSLQTLMVKMSSAFAVFMAGTGIDLVGLNEEALVQTASAACGLRFLFAVPPMILMAGAFLVFYLKKDMGTDTHLENTGETE